MRFTYYNSNRGNCL